MLALNLGRAEEGLEKKEFYVQKSRYSVSRVSIILRSVKRSPAQYPFDDEGADEYVLLIMEASQ